jgi:hypothetical protein
LAWIQTGAGAGVGAAERSGVDRPVMLITDDQRNAEFVSPTQRLSVGAQHCSTFILFRHPDQAYLVQCRAGYDATRTPPTYSICYILK